ncbi:MAG: 1,4-dihydroxy-6-naphthoate synthase, partial [Sediminibacterium sp.]|nr:1,4-dihydroxy-6-naphthoate synthase [Sediminibacterium sp.]
ITTPQNAVLTAAELNQLPIAIPGEHTTAHVLLSFAFPHLEKKVFTVFHQIEAAVLSGEVAAGVIIHENRFTYQDKGLVLIKDLGKYWEDQLQSPIPLGGIAIQRNIPHEIQVKVNRHIAASITKAREQYPLLSDYVVKHAQEMSEQVMRQHIQLYVNDFSLSAGDTGRKAVSTFLKVCSAMRGIPVPETATVFI